MEREQYDPQSFGDVCLDLVSSNLRLRFTRDRGQYFISVGSTQDAEWFNEYTVLVFLNATDEADQLVVEKWSSANNVADVVARYLAKIDDAFGSRKYAETREALHRIETTQVEKLFGKFKAPPN